MHRTRTLRVVGMALGLAAGAVLGVINGSPPVASAPGS
jgi:hypothetical protein